MQHINIYFTLYYHILSIEIISFICVFLFTFVWGYFLVGCCMNYIVYYYYLNPFYYQCVIKVNLLKYVLNG